MARFLNHYECSECGTSWNDEWDCTCDDRCPNCNTSISPSSSDDLEPEAQEETEEEHAVRLQKISDEVKADIAAGRYRHGQLRPEVSAKKPKMEIKDSWFRDLMESMFHESVDFGKTKTGRIPHLRSEIHEYYTGFSPKYFVMDEASHFKIDSDFIYSLKPEKTGQERDGPKKPYWTQPIPQKGPETPPSSDKRAKLRAKRKKNKK